MDSIRAILFLTLVLIAISIVFWLIVSDYALRKKDQEIFQGAGLFMFMASIVLAVGAARFTDAVENEVINVNRQISSVESDIDNLALSLRMRELEHSMVVFGFFQEERMLELLGDLNSQSDDDGVNALIESYSLVLSSRRENRRMSEETLMQDQEQYELMLQRMLSLKNELEMILNELRSAQTGAGYLAVILGFLSVVQSSFGFLYFRARKVKTC